MNDGNSLWYMDIRNRYSCINAYYVRSWVDVLEEK